MEPPNPNKRLCQNANSLPSVPDFNQKHVDLVISSFLSLTDLHSLSSSLSIGCSFDRALKKLLRDSGDGSTQDLLINRGLQLVSLLHESTMRCYRERATLHNSNSWFLPHELTFKVFSLLDTKSLMQASACCTMFNKCTVDPLCYTHIDLTMASQHVDDDLVRSMIHHAGKELRSLKVGRDPYTRTSLLTGSCLDPISFGHSFSGNLLESLHLYHLRSLDLKSLGSVLSACSNLIDLKIVGWKISPIDKLLESVPRKCKHLFIEKEMGPVQLIFINVKPFMKNCPNITSLSLISFTLCDLDAFFLIKGLSKLKYLNLSRTYELDGSFMRHAGICCNDILLETLILKDCSSLEEKHVLGFFDSVITGHYRFIQHIDVSNIYGLKSVSGRYCIPKFCLEKLKEKKPGLTFVADFTKPYNYISSDEED